VREIFPVLILLPKTPFNKVSLDDRLGGEGDCLQYSSKRERNICFICGLFNHTVSCSGCISRRNFWSTKSIKLQRIQKGRDVILRH
jgi:hypothetical protein